MDAEITDGKKSFSEYCNISMAVLDKAEELTNLNLPDQTEFIANLSCKFIGRNYFSDGGTQVGLKVFELIETPLLTIAFFEDYNNEQKAISYKLQGTKLNYLSEYAAYDNGYWHYIIVDQKLFDSKVEIARMEIKNLIKFTRGAESQSLHIRKNNILFITPGINHIQVLVSLLLHTRFVYSCRMILK